MDIVNYNNSYSNINLQKTELPKKDGSEPNCFSDDDWTGNAADAVGAAFSNMDGLLELFQEQANLNRVN